MASCVFASGENKHDTWPWPIICPRGYIMSQASYGTVKAIVTIAQMCAVPYALPRVLPWRIIDRPFQAFLQSVHFSRQDSKLFYVVQRFPLLLDKSLEICKEYSKFSCNFLHETHRSPGSNLCSFALQKSKGCKLVERKGKRSEVRYG